MPSKSDLIPLKDYAPEKDRRRKLTQEQRKEIKTAYEGGGYSYNQLAVIYGVSKRLIIFIVKPESLKRNKELRAEKGGSKLYYNTEYNTKAQKEHRHYKKKIYKENP